MHISEGILSGSVLITGWVGTFAGISIGLKKIDNSKIVRTALISSAFFLASLVNVKVGPSSTHLSLIGPMGLILGCGIFPAVFTALLLQAVLFHFGGLFVLGVNTFIMSFSGLIVYLLFRKFIDSENKMAAMSFSFIAGALAVMIGVCLVGLSLGVSDGNFINAAKIIVAAHLPVALIEGIVTMFLIMLLKKYVPEFLS